MCMTDDSPTDQVRRYISQYGDKPCCFADLRLYIDLLSADEQRQVMAHSYFVKFVPDMTYNMFVGMLNLAQSINHS